MYVFVLYCAVLSMLYSVCVFCAQACKIWGGDRIERFLLGKRIEPPLHKSSVMYTEHKRSAHPDFLEVEPS